MNEDSKEYPVTVKEGACGKELHISFPGTRQRAVVALDAFRENGGSAPCLQLLVYEAGADEPAVAVRFNDDGSIAEVVAEKEIVVVPQGTASRWQARRDEEKDRRFRETLVIENVDLDLLDEQRLALFRTIHAVEKGLGSSADDLGLLDGLQNMLDAWSDERAETMEGESP
jgi:hypothetical protein